MLEIIGLYRKYPEFHLQANFNVGEGEFFSLLGPSGCGKTTLLRLISGLERPDGGRIILGGREITNEVPSKRRIGLVFQDYALFPHLNVEENVGYGLVAQKRPAAQRRRRIEELLRLFEISHIAKREIRRLSGGEQQRVALARALAPEPLAILMDEPFSALDYNLRRRLREELKQYQSKMGFTAVFVTHHQEDALALSDRLAVMGRGCILQEGTPRSVYEQPNSVEVAQLLGEVNLIPGQVVEDDCGLLEVAVEGEQQNWRMPNPGGTYASGQSIWIANRPEDWEIDDAGFSVRVLRQEYLGHMMILHIEGQGWTGRYLTSKYFGLGDDAVLRLTPRNIMIFPR
jgi:spermidine/putrescine transport system ATP-binding protein